LPYLDLVTSQWLAEREAANGQGGGAEERPARFPTFREWLVTREGRRTQA
jgi:hypothetical protein